MRWDGHVESQDDPNGHAQPSRLSDWRFRPVSWLWEPLNPKRKVTQPGARVGGICACRGRVGTGKARLLAAEHQHHVFRARIDLDRHVDTVMKIMHSGDGPLRAHS